MSWSLGYDTNWHRDIGYGVPARCDHPGCDEKIDRGLAHVCGGEPYGGEDGCGLYFCAKHGGGGLCERCEVGELPFEKTPDAPEWIEHKLTDESWADWRRLNPTWMAEHAPRSNSQLVARRLVDELANGTAERDARAWMREAAITLARLSDETREPPSDAQIMALWRECSIPTDENNHTTGPLPFARALLKLTAS